jgi:broad specificity phosphatase PhoE
MGSADEARYFEPVSRQRVDGRRNSTMTIIVSRHGESVAAAHSVANGDPSRDNGLTNKGQDGARELGKEVADDPIALCVTSLFPRTRQTGEIALTGRRIPFLQMAELNDIRYGYFEGRPTEEYDDWSSNIGMDGRPPDGGESRMDVARRMCDAFGEILRRNEECILVVTHELLIAYLRMAIDGSDPSPDHPDVPYSTAFRWPDADVETGLQRIRAWLAGGEA